MTSIPINTIKKLRKDTLLNIKECKEALISSNGDIDKAKKILKIKGLTIADKRKYRRTSNGAVFLLTEGYITVILELTCETEFVAINSVFLSTGLQLGKHIIQNKIPEITNEMKNIVKESISVIKENMVLRNITLWELENDEILGSYKHDDNKIVVIVKVRCNNIEHYNKENISLLANEIAMHICAYRPSFISVNHIDIEYIEENRNIFKEHIKENKYNIKLEKKIISGKLDKYLKANCLLEQKFVKDNNRSVAEVINHIEKLQGDIEILDFKYLQVEPCLIC